MQIKFLYPLILVVLTGPSHATTVVAARTSSMIVLGGDSKLVTGDHADAGLRCKIKSANQVFWGQAAILEIPSRNFNAGEIITTAISASGSLSSRIVAFENAMILGLTPILNELTTNEPRWFAREQLDKPAFEAAFASLENQILQLHVRSFTARKKGSNLNLQIDRLDSPSPSYPAGLIVTLGHNEAAQAELAKNHDIIRTMGMESAVRHLIETEIAAIPAEVGPPIAVVKLTKGGATWISKGICP